MIVRLNSTSMAVLSRCDISGVARLLYLHLWLRAKRSGHWFCAPHLQDMPQLVGAGERSVFRASKQLQAMRLIDVRVRRSRGLIGTYYRVWPIGEAIP